MKTIEIRQKKGSFYFIIVFLPLLVIGFAYYVFLSGSPQVKQGTKYTFIALLIYSGYMVYTETKKHKENKPALIVSEFSIEIYMLTLKPVCICGKMSKVGKLNWMKVHIILFWTLTVSKKESWFHGWTRHPAKSKIF